MNLWVKLHLYCSPTSQWHVSTEFTDAALSCSGHKAARCTLLSYVTPLSQMMPVSTQHCRLPNHGRWPLDCPFRTSSAPPQPMQSRNCCVWAHVERTELSLANILLSALFLPILVARMLRTHDQNLSFADVSITTHRMLLVIVSLSWSQPSAGSL